MKKQLIALLVALLMTACVGGSMLAIGGVALFNPNGTTAANSKVQAAQVADTSASLQSQIQQLQDLITQYQAREQQYQSRESQYQQQLDQANAQIQQAQQQMQQIQALLNALQERGLITVTSDGRIYINR
jgi:peptidoglycan hydrolase CwlO-like protein